MEWDLILQFDVKDLFFTLSLILGIVAFVVVVEFKLSSRIMRFYLLGVRIVSNKINWAWFIRPIIDPSSKLYILLHRLLLQPCSKALY
ncbi:hypothetical protein [Ammoniphilus sp. YIM 78166]|uniref:hypothetical protein n=1 Tax=Ammoniphilus sp. YIM 78166 TaxID=1644106 RepID=UPI00106FE257|nr:hypothetical protein [Ammoniphilus sp. YIM 78166]